MTQKVFPCWKCGKDVGQIPANLLMARAGPGPYGREYAHRNCEKFQEKPAAKEK